MSLRSTPRHIVTVQNFRPTLGTSGQTRYVEPDGDPITVRCNVYPVSATEIDTGGLTNAMTKQIFLHNGTWPGDQHSLITYAGQEYEQFGPPVVYDMSSTTGHTTITIRARGGGNGRLPQ